MGRDGTVRAWSKKLQPELESLLDQGTHVELMVPGGLLILQRDPEGALHISWLCDEDAALSLRS